MKKKKGEITKEYIIITIVFATIVTLIPYRIMYNKNKIEQANGNLNTALSRVEEVNKVIYSNTGSELANFGLIIKEVESILNDTIDNKKSINGINDNCNEIIKLIEKANNEIKDMTVEKEKYQIDTIDTRLYEIDELIKEIKE